MDDLGPVRLNFPGIADHYDISPDYSNPEIAVRPGAGLLGSDSGVDSGASLPGVGSWTAPSSRPELLSDHLWKLPDNGFTRALGLTYDPMEGAMRKVLDDPTQPFAAHAVAGVADIALNLRNFAAAPLRAAVGLGGLVQSSYALTADLGGPHSDIAWKELVLNPGERVLNAVGNGLSKYWNSPPSEWKEMATEDATNILNWATKGIQEKRDRGDWGGATGDFLVLPALGSKVAQRILSSNIVATATESSVPASDWFARPVSDQAIQRGWYTGSDGKGRMWEVYPPDKMAVDNRVEFIRGMRLPEDQQRSVLNSLRTSYAFLLKDPQATVPSYVVTRLFASEAGDLISEFVAARGPKPGTSGGRLIPNYDGLIDRNDYAVRLFGTKLDSNGAPAFGLVGDQLRFQPNVPAGTALVDHVFAASEPGAFDTTLKFALDSLKEAGRDQALLYTRSGPTITQIERLGLPYEFRVAGSSVEPNAPDKIWNYWSRAVFPDNWKRLPTTWSQAFAEGHDQVLLNAGQTRPALQNIDALTGMSEYERMTHNIGLLRKNNPINTLASLPLREQQLVDDGFLFGGIWKLNQRNAAGIGSWGDAFGQVNSYFDSVKPAGKFP